MVVYKGGIQKVLQDIHNSVLRRFVYVSDTIKWHKIEHWESSEELPLTGKFQGDCDAFALMCRKICRAKELRSRLIFCRIPDTGEYHLVCECAGYILDNRCLRIAAIQELDYEWLYMSGFEKGEPWHRIRIESA